MDQGNTAFLLIMAALVLLMTPGLAFFYGGLVKAKSVISMMMMSFGAIGLIGVIWVPSPRLRASQRHGPSTGRRSA
jgi:Amt family ammonium transporter